MLFGAFGDLECFVNEKNGVRFCELWDIFLGRFGEHLII